ncbi:MAG: YceI family protein [Gemmataceae bacterium]
MRKAIGWALAILGCTALWQAGWAGEAKKIELTPDNTKIEWTGTKPGGKHVGGFTKVSGSAEVAAGAVSKIALDIDCNSLTSDTPKLTKHLKSADFFEVVNHPKATFVTTKIEAGSDVAKATHTITGDLTIRGKTKSIVIPATVSAKDGLTLSSSFTISKKDFGMTYGEGKIDDAVTIKVSVKAK